MVLSHLGCLTRSFFSAKDRLVPIRIICIVSSFPSSGGARLRKAAPSFGSIPCQFAISKCCAFSGQQNAVERDRIGSRTYTDLGAQFRVGDRFTFFGSVNNVFNVSPPLSTAGNPHYDFVGTYFNAGARVKFR